MADRVDTPVETTQPPRLHTAVDVVGAQPRPEQLGPAHHAVLSVRQRSDHVVRGGFAAHIAV
jgi:hypothetical protein